MTAKKEARPALPAVVGQWVEDHANDEFPLFAGLQIRTKMLHGGSRIYRGIVSGLGEMCIYPNSMTMAKEDPGALGSERSFFVRPFGWVCFANPLPDGINRAVVQGLLNEAALFGSGLAGILRDRVSADAVNRHKIWDKAYMDRLHAAALQAIADDRRRR